jgi:hypothetical protein
MPNTQNAISNHEYRNVPITVLVESASNPGKRFDEKSSEELARQLQNAGRSRTSSGAGRVAMCQALSTSWSGYADGLWHGPSKTERHFRRPSLGRQHRWKQTLRSPSATHANQQSREARATHGSIGRV